MRVWKAQPQHMQLTFLRYVNVNIALALTFFYGTRRRRQRQRCHGAANKQRSIRKGNERETERERWRRLGMHEILLLQLLLLFNCLTAAAKTTATTPTTRRGLKTMEAVRRECQPRQVVYLGYLRRTNWVSSVRQSCPQFCISSSLPSPLSTPLAYALALKWPWKVGQTRKAAALAAYAAYLPLPLPLSPPLLPSSSALFNVFLSLVYLFDDNFQSEQVEVQKDSETEGRADGHGKQKTTRRQLPDIIFCSGSSAWNEEVNKELSVCRVRFPYALLFS